MEFTLEFIQIFFITLWYAGPIVVSLIALIVVLGHIIGFREGWSKVDSVYYAFITATTVGYGDFYPKKRLSKIMAIVITFVGIVLTGVIVALALHSVTHAARNAQDYQQLINKLEQVEEAYE